MSDGQLGHIGIAKETTWGTPVAATDYIEALSESMTTEIERFETKNIIAGLYEPDDSAGVNRHEGDIVFGANPETLGFILDGAFGVTSGTEILSGFLYSTEYTPATAEANSLHPLPPYTIEIFRDMGSSAQYTGGQFASVEMSVSPNQELCVTAATISKNFNPIAKTTASFPGSPTEPFLFDACSISLAGVAITRMEALTFTFDNQLEGVPTLNATNEIAKVRRTGSQLVRLAGTFEFSDFSDFDSFRNKTEQQLIATFTAPNSFSLVIDVPRMLFTEMPVQLAGRERVTGDFAAMGRYSAGSGHAVKVTLTTVSTFS